MSGRRTKPGALATGLTVALYLSSGCASPLPEAREPGPRVVLIGIDGATFDVIDPLLDTGRLPHLARLMESGARGVLRSEAPILSPPLWTTIVTGRPREVHGIKGFFYSSPGGEEVLVDSTQRQVGALWSWLGPLGRTSGFVGWWATWPAEPVAGWMVSDRMARSQWSAWPGGVRTEDLVYPSALYKRLASRVFGTSDLTREDWRTLADFSDPELDRLEALHRPVPYDALSDLKFAYLAQRSYEEIALVLLAEEQPDLTGIFLIAPDPISHSFWRYYEPTAFAGVEPEEIPATAVERLGVLVPAIYQHVDGFLGRLLPLLAENTTVLLVSDHGFRASGELRPSGEHDLDGILVAAGGPIRPHSEVRASIYDIAPTVLRLLDLPLPRDLEGRVLEEILTEEFRAAHPQRTVPSLEPLVQRRQQGRDRTGPGDPDMKERLRSLGYLDGSAASSSAEQLGGSER